MEDVNTRGYFHWHASKWDWELCNSNQSGIHTYKYLKEISSLSCLFVVYFTMLSTARNIEYRIVGQPPKKALCHLHTCDLDKAPHTPVSVNWKFQCRFPQVWHKTWLHIAARNCALPFPWHTHKNCFTKNRTKISVVTLASWNSY